MDLRQVFEDTCKGRLSDYLHPRVADPWKALCDAYETPVRAYHNMSHVRDCIKECEAQKLGDIARLALFYHDAVCVPGRSDNEYASGDLFSGHFTGTGAVGAYAMARVRSLIMLTRHTELPRDNTAAMVVDIDMSVLGQVPEIFDQYDNAIRREYEHFPDDEYEAGRRTFLEGILGRKKIYYTDVYQSRCEKQARDNIRRRLGFTEECECWEAVNDREGMRPCRHERLPAGGGPFNNSAAPGPCRCGASGPPWNHAESCSYD